MERLPIRYSLLYTAWGLMLFASILLVLASLPGYLVRGLVTGGVVEAPPWMLAGAKIVSGLASLGGALLSIGLAVLLFVRRRQEGMALFISFYLLVYAVVMCGPLEAIPLYWDVLEGAAIPIQTAVLTVPSVIIFATFPDGRFVPAWTRWAVAGSILVNIGVYLRPLESWYAFSDPISQVLGAVFIVLLVASMYAQIYRYRHVSGFIQKQQTKWVVVGLFLWVFYISLSSIPWVLLQNLPPGAPTPSWTLFGGIGWWISISIFPLSLAIAILRARLWDIDLLIRRTLVYAALTGILGLVYFGGVVLLQNIFDALAGQHESPLITVLSTLAIAALFNPLRSRLQHFIDRRFYRKKYDAERTLARFASTARDVVDIETLTAAMLGAVDETMQPEQASLWLKQR